MQSQFKKRAFVLSVGASAIAALVACGGGGGGGSESGASLSPSQVQGKAVDFYLSQANVVFTDCNNQTTTTDNEGNFTVPSGCAKSAIKVSGGTDIGTGLSFGGVLQAPATDLTQGGTLLVSPMTTLLSQVGTDQSAALASKLGVQASDLVSKDPMNDSGLLQNVVVTQQLIEQIAKALTGLSQSTGGTLTLEAAAAAAAAAVASVLVGSTGSADLSDPTLIAKIIVAAVKNSAASLPASVVAKIEAIADNLAALIAPVIAGRVANVNDGLDSVELNATPAETLASLQKAGSIHAVVDSVQSSESNLLVAALSPAALRDTTLSDSLAGLGNAVADGDEDTINEAATTLGGNVNTSNLGNIIHRIKYKDFLRVDSISVNDTVVPVSSAITVRGGTISSLKTSVTQVGSPFGDRSSEIRAGVRYRYNGNELNAVIQRIVLTFNSNNKLVAAEVPAGTAFEFVLKGSTNTRLSITSTGDNLLDSTTGQLVLPIDKLQAKLKSSGILSAAQVDALTPKAPARVDIALAIAGTSGKLVRVRAESGNGNRTKSLPVIRINAGDSSVVGYGKRSVVTLLP
ncbi:TEK signal peptide protein [Ralstonia syzygii subsp. celebesensis]|uniref:Membrane associated, exported and processed into extracellular protein EXP n=1 Tax=blood disease bacterium R229 TaxID=741978 RepID=G2ZST4_9RALS|nr:TEK signal peptide protein [Ralstonia syzygii]QQV54888.1 TEK signal peptide protein [Ralstonia syzygii subsp. celebesensis]CCA82097.1 membrane associated precursor, exported and processed into extracellular protein EXP [blood disease bacterium R229]